MGLFGRSNADKIADNIREQVKIILLQLKGIDEVFCRDGGASYSNVQEISMYMQRIAEARNNIQQDLDKLSAVQQSRVVVPWFDGRLHPILFWDVSFRMTMKDIEQEIDKLL